MKARLLVEKRGGLFNLRPLYDWLRGAPDGLYRLDVARVRRRRTLDQNGWLWGCIYPMLLDALIEQGWEFTSCEEVHEYFKSLMTSKSVVNRHTAEVVTFPGSTAAMDTVTFGSYCERLREYGSEYLGIDIPDPDRYWKDHEKNTEHSGV